MVDDYIKFAFIALCFIIALVSYWFSNSKRDWAFLALAMGFTLTSDYFLLLTSRHATGVLIFCFVHIIYILRVSFDWEKSLMKIGATVCIGWLILAISAFTPLLPHFNRNPIIIFAAIYAALFIQNIIAHVKYYRYNGQDALPLINRKIMLIGLVLFALCDIHVLMFNLPLYLNVPPAIGIWGRTWMWVFYAPSQLLLCISAVQWKKDS